MFTVPQNALIQLAVTNIPVEEEWWIDFQCDFHQGVMDLGATYLVPQLLADEQWTEVRFGLDFMGYVYELVNLYTTLNSPTLTVGYIDDEVLAAYQLPYSQLIPRSIQRVRSTG